MNLNEPNVATLKARQELRIIATPKPPPRGEFSVSRWPNTYAYDQVRSRVPSVDSRAEAAGAVRRLAEQAGLPVEYVKEQLATAYCIENNIDLPCSLWGHLR